MFEMFEQAVFVAGCCVCIASLLLKKKHSVLRKHENPHVQGFGRLNPHVVIAVWGSEQEARTLVMQPKCSSNVADLNGMWGFQLFRSSEDAFRYRETADIDDITELKTIVVPGSWQLQCPGDLPIFTNAGYAFALSQIDTPCENPTGYYVKEFALKSSWRDRRIVLHFAGVDSAFYVWVNGKYVGISKDSRLPADFDVTSVVMFNECDDSSLISRGAVINKLQVLVCRMSDGHIFENQDMWSVSGIFRDVMVVSYPLPLHIYDFSWHVDVEFFTSCYAATHSKFTLVWL
jgi:beta-galactosidase